MSWLSDRTGVHLNLKPLAPVIGGAVGSFIPGVGTAVGAGLGRFLSGVGNGEDPLHAGIGGLESGGTAYGLSKILGLMQGGEGVQPGAATPPPTPGPESVGTTPSAIGTDALSGKPIMGGGAGASLPTMTDSSIAAGAPTSAAERALNFAKSAGSSFLHNAPAVQAVGGVASGVLNARNESASRDLQRQEFEYQKHLNDLQIQRQQNAEGTREQLLAALLQRFGIGAAPPPPGAR